jgi:N-acetylglutamate synthase-like GNAT family acetyltransferase
MALASQAEIVDITASKEYERYLNRCFVGPSSKGCKRRVEHLKKAVAEGFHKKLLLSDGQVVGQIEYSPAEVSYYPIMGDKVIVLNCIWVLRKAKGHNFGKRLLEDMMKSERDASGFATIVLKNHWSPWFEKEQMEKLGFKPLDSISVSHRAKCRGRVFSIYLMWMPNADNAVPATWDKQKLLKGTTCCTAHPLYHPQTYEPKQILRKR